MTFTFEIILQASLPLECLRSLLDFEIRYLTYPIIRGLWDWTIFLPSLSIQDNFHGTLRCYHGTSLIMAASLLKAAERVVTSHRSL